MKPLLAKTRTARGRTARDPLGVVAMTQFLTFVEVAGR
jgi:hypothetical protein